MGHMKGLSEIEKVRSEIEKCVGCGNCLYYCPVYAEINEENYVARGRNRLLMDIVDNHRDLVEGAGDRFDKCLLCGRCTMVCPQGVRNDLIMMAARAELVEKEGLPLTKAFAFRKMLKDRKRMSSMLKTASRFQWILPRTKEKRGKIHHIPSEKTGKICHVPMFFAGLRGKGQLPTIAGRFLSDQVSVENAPPEGVKRKNIRVAYFSGCAAEFVFPEVGKSLISLLNRMGVDVFFPKDQGCCGLAVYATGDIETAREMSLHNLRVLSELDVDYIVTSCATCGSALKEGWIELARDEMVRNKFERLAERVRDISELLIDLAEYQPLRFRSLLPDNTRVTLHDPCHLANYQEIREAPRQILRQVFGDNFVEMDNRGCCGSGGSFNVYNYSLSQKIGKNKIDSIERTYADVVVNTCPGCMIQLIDGIERNKLPQKVVHMVEIIDPME